MIIYGIVRDLKYLHDDSPKRIVHRDLNPQNFLLDTEFKPKISDFEHGKNFVNYQGRIQRGAGGLGPPTVGTPWKEDERRGRRRGKKERIRGGLVEGEGR